MLGPIKETGKIQWKDVLSGSYILRVLPEHALPALIFEPIHRSEEFKVYRDRDTEKACSRHLNLTTTKSKTLVHPERSQALHHWKWV
jgi:hypothetical protein